ncbi:MAG: TRAP transporter substrate-binding protein [Planctomycetaceae bacterium]|nr:TRAP transporter substrate-binding protein [Planctomycetaceae bacterium]
MKKWSQLLCWTVGLVVLAGSVHAGTVRMKLGTNHSEDHPTAQALVFFKDKVEKDSNRGIRIQLFMNATLGNEPEVIQQLKNGAVEMTRVSTSTLENFDPLFKALALPYLFTSKDNFYEVLGGPIGEKLFTAHRDSGYVGLTFYDGGARSFYTKYKPIYKPEDLNGQKLRIMDSQTAIRMVQMMGGIPTPMSYGELYAALQQGVIDGAENNPTALTIGRHGEVAKFYSLDEHNMIPDLLIISTKVWDGLTPEQQKILKDAAVASTEYHKDLWRQAEEDALTEAREKLGVTINEVEKAPFIEITKPLYDEYASDPDISELVQAIRATQK